MTDAEVIVRKSTPGDVTALLSFIQPFVEQEKLLPRTSDELMELVDSSFLAEVDGQIVGYASLEVYSKKLAEIRTLAVDPSLRRSGIGGRLVQRCVERAGELNILEVMAVTSTEEFFQTCGFHFTLPGEKKALFYDSRR